MALSGKNIDLMQGVTMIKEMVSFASTDDGVTAKIQDHEDIHPDQQ